GHVCVTMRPHADDPYRRLPPVSSIRHEFACCARGSFDSSVPAAAADSVTVPDREINGAVDGNPRGGSEFSQMIRAKRFSILWFSIQVVVQYVLLLLAFKFLLPGVWARQLAAGWV